MKILHTSDLHLCSPLTARLSPDKIKIRKRELMNTFLNLVELADREGARGFIIAGDLFDSDNVKLSAIKDTLAIISSKPNISFYYLYGNHEGDVIRSSGLPLPSNLFIFGEDWTYFKLDELTIAGRCTHSDDMWKTLKLDENDKNMVVLHGALTDNNSEGENISRKDIATLPIDYLALGHYHTFKYEKIGPRCQAVYSGTPEGRGFDEIDDKGVSLIDFDGYTLTPKFVKTAKRTIYAVDITIADGYGTYETDALVSYATRVIPSESLVRVTLQGERSPFASFDMGTFKDRYKDKFFYIEFVDETKVHLSIDDYINDKTLKGEFIRGVLAEEELTDEEKEAIITIGLRALRREEFD